MSDAVNHPSHYTAYPVEVIDIIREALVDERADVEIMLYMVLGAEGFRSYCLGNEIKYRMRAGLKGDAAEDLAKALKYKEFRDSAGLGQPGVALGEAYLKSARERTKAEQPKDDGVILPDCLRGFQARTCESCAMHPCSYWREMNCKSNDRREWRSK